MNTPPSWRNKKAKYERDKLFGSSVPGHVGVTFYPKKNRSSQKLLDIIKKNCSIFLYQHSLILR